MDLLIFFIEFILCICFGVATGLLTGKLIEFSIKMYNKWI